MQGRLIVFEGVEGCGKTTQLGRSQAWLVASGWLERLQQALPAATSPLVLTREPGGTGLGQHLRQLLLHSNLGPAEEIQARAELLLYAADRAQHVETCLKPALAQGRLILCDRYTDSTLAYQGYGRGLSLELIEQLNQIATGGLKSDLTLWLDVDVAIGLQRAQQRSQRNSLPQQPDRIEAGALGFHQRVQQGFTALAQADPQRIVRIDASQPEAAVAAQIQTVLQQRLSTWYPRPSLV